MRIFRRRLNYANVTATLALVFAMSGGALAAKHYVINSTSQLSPKVLKALKGKTGKTGPAGAMGKEGPPGKEGGAGREGPPGKNGTGSPLFFKAPKGTGPTVIATLDGAQIVAECNSSIETVVTLHPTANFGVLHGWYDQKNEGKEVFTDETKIGTDINLQLGVPDWEGWFSYLGPNGGITTAVFGDDSGGSHSAQCLVWGTLTSASTGTTGGA
jgi:hypothetical protein